MKVRLLLNNRQRLPNQLGFPLITCHLHSQFIASIYKISRRVGGRRRGYQTQLFLSGVLPNVVYVPRKDDSIYVPQGKELNLVQWNGEGVHLSSVEKLDQEEYPGETSSEVSNHGVGQSIQLELEGLQTEQELE